MNSKSLNPQYRWLCYAAQIVEGEPLHPKIWRFGKMVRDLLNKLAFSEDEGDAIEVDPFTDPDEGLPIFAKYLKNPNRKKGEQYYDVYFPAKSVPRPLTDEECEAFMKMRPLTQVLPKYGMRDFEKALEGIQNFDEENEIGAFDDEDWLQRVEEVKAQYEGEEAESDDKKKPLKKKTVKTYKEKELSDDDEEEEEAPKKHKAKKVEEPEEEEEDEEDEVDCVSVCSFVESCSNSVSSFCISSRKVVGSPAFNTCADNKKEAAIETAIRFLLMCSVYLTKIYVYRILHIKYKK
jgi:hypothetical protein